MKLLYMISNVKDLYFYLFSELTDPRMKLLKLMPNLFNILIIVAIYLFFVLKWGQNLMKDRKPFAIDKIIICNNIIQIYLSIHLTYKILKYAYVFGNYNWICEPIDFTYDPAAVAIFYGVHEYFLIKVLDLLDTVFFVLKKKFEHITFLHVYHHAGMVVTSWFAVNFFAGGNTIFIGLTNSIVHMFMYTYYLLTILEPTFKNNLRWKKYVTNIQMIQFLANVIHSLFGIFTPNCKYPLLPPIFLLAQNIFMLVLFSDFYIKAYNKKKN